MGLVSCWARSASWAWPAVLAAVAITDAARPDKAKVRLMQNVPNRFSVAWVGALRSACGCTPTRGATSGRGDVEPELEGVEIGHQLGQLLAVPGYLDVAGLDRIRKLRLMQDDLVQRVAREPHSGIRIIRLGIG